MAADDKMKIGSSLRRFRKAFGLTQDDVAEAIGIFRPLYTKYEGDKNMPSVDTVMKIAVAFNVSVDYLVGLSDMPRPPKISEADTELVELAVAYNNALQNVLEKRGLKDIGHLQDNQSAQRSDLRRTDAPTD